MTPREKVMRILASEDEVTAAQIAERVGISTRAVGVHLQRALAEGALRRVRNGVYTATVVPGK